MNQENETPQEKRPSFLLPLLVFAWIALILYFFLSRHWVLLHTYGSLLEGFTIQWDALPWHDVLRSYAGCLPFWLLGALLLRCFDLYIPSDARLGLSFALGTGLWGIFAELLATMGIFFRIIVYPLLFLLLLTLLILSAIHKRSRLPDEPKGKDFRFIRRDRYWLWHRRFQKSLVRPQSKVARALFALATLFVVLITLLTFYHALFFPETNWDSLIYYIDFAQRIFEENRIPTKVVAQVGIGLGANYPHLYQLVSSSIALLWGEWHDLFAQALPPLFAMLSVVLFYHLMLYLTRHPLWSILLTLLFRTIPYGIVYSIYATDYSLVIFYTIALLYLLMLYHETHHFPYLLLAGLLCAFSTHINYLMWVLWVPWMATVLLAHINPPKPPEEPDELTSLEDYFRIPLDRTVKEPEFTYQAAPASLGRFITSGKFLFLFFFCLFIASLWYLRNWLVTGNPVYPFFHHLLDGININPVVLANAQREWLANGDGIGRFSPTLLGKILSSWSFFVTYEHAWKLAPHFVALCIPGILIFVIASLKNVVLPSRDEPFFNAERRFLLSALTLFLIILFYHYFIASYYLYQIIAILPLIPLFTLPLIRRLNPRPFRTLLILLILGLAIIPGLPFSMMGFKFHSTSRWNGKVYSPLSLLPLRSPGMSEDFFYRLCYPDDLNMWKAINENLLGSTILTQENRYHMYDPFIKIVHLDDLEIQKLYSMTDDEEKLNQLFSRGITYYLYIPMEDRANQYKPAEEPSLAELVGVDRWRENPLILEEAGRYGPNVLYRFNWLLVLSKLDQPSSPSLPSELPAPNNSPTTNPSNPNLNK